MRIEITVCLVSLAIITGGASIGGSAGAARSSVLPDGASRSSAASSDRDYYTLVNLGTFGGNVSSASSVNEIGWVTGYADHPADKYTEAALWRDGDKIPLGTLGGPNSGVDWSNHNNFGLIAGISETAQVDPLGEDWSCQAFFPTTPDTKHVCLGFSWRDGRMTPLRTLGGINGYAAGTNDWGQIVGWAETRKHDRTCTAVTHSPNSFYQVLQFKPVVWEPNGRIRELPTLPGDPDGAATATNDRGQVVGISGTCDQAVGRFTAAHAVIWQDGTVTNIGNFGGISWNTPNAINNRGEVAGFANLPGDANGQFQPIGFVWTKDHGLTKILPLRGDTNTLANGINDRGQVVGVSYNANTGAPSRAFIWENGRTMNLNCFLPVNSGLHLLAANDIDDRGRIVGQALVKGTPEKPAFLLIPRHRDWDPATATPLQLTPTTPTLPQGAPQPILRRFGVAIP